MSIKRTAQKIAYESPRLLQTTVAARLSQLSSQTVLHTPSTITSTRPAVALPLTRTVLVIRGLV